MARLPAQVDPQGRPPPGIRYELTVALDGSADDAYQGDSSEVQFDFDAV
jgi:hypothetical protein